MKLTIKYFGLLAEITQCNEEVIECSKETISELMEVLFMKYPDLKTKEFQVAQNHEIVPMNTGLTNSEIALLPPFSGG